MTGREIVAESARRADKEITNARRHGEPWYMQRIIVDNFQYVAGLIDALRHVDECRGAYCTFKGLQLVERGAMEKVRAALAAIPKEKK